MVERTVGCLPNNMNQCLLFPKIVCTDEFIFACSFGNQSVHRFFEYSFATEEWRLLKYDGLSSGFIYNKMVILKKKFLVIHGMLISESNEGIFRTYSGDTSERPIRFRLIGTQAAQRLDQLHNFFTDGDNLYVSSTMLNEFHKPQLTISQLDTANNWSELFRSAKFADGNINTMFVYNEILYTFPKGRNFVRIDLSKLIAYDLKTGHRSMVDLLPAGGPQPGFPGLTDSTDTISLARCPVEPRHVYLIFNNDPLGTSWEIWRLDPAAMLWHRLPRYEVRPHNTSGDLQATCAITPSGRLYVLRSAHHVSWLNNLDEDRFDRRTASVMFSAQVRGTVIQPANALSCLQDF